MTKDDVLFILKKEKDYLSGEKISSTLGISRAAVNAAVKALRSAGYEIESSTNKGYLLLSGPDKVSAGELMAFLPKNRVAKVVCLDIVDSTNEYARNLALNGAPDGQIVIAEEQTAGRGRRGRSFQSPKSNGLYLSALFRPDRFKESIPSITAWTAVAASNAIENIWGIRPDIKWVNDLLLNRKKICGILTEMSLESESGYIQYVVIGIGINVSENHWDCSPELSRIATSLEAETGRRFSRAMLAAELIKELDIMTSSWPLHKDKYLEAYRSKCIMVGQKVRLVFQNEERTGTVLTVNDDFSLSVKFDDGSQADISSGEVSVRGLYG